MSNRQAEVGTEITATLKDEDGRTGPVTWEWNFSGTGTVITQENEDETAKYTPLDAHLPSDLQVTATYKNADGSEATARASDDQAFVQPVEGRPSTRQQPTSNATNTPPKFIDSNNCNNLADTAAVSPVTREVDENTDCRRENVGDSQ